MIGDKIKKLRESRNWTIRVLAEKIGVTQGMIPRYESGKASPRGDVIQSIADAFGIPLSDLLDEKTPISLVSEKYDPRKFERALADARQLDEHTKTIVALLIDEFIEKKKLKDYRNGVIHLNDKLK